MIGRVGQGLNDVGQLEALYVAASETKADMTGLREETGFFQKVRTKNAETKQTSEQYVYYTVYSMSKDSWDALCKKYLMDIMGGTDLTTETQKKIGALFSEMKADADKKQAAKRAKANAEAAKVGLKAKELDAKEAQTKAAVEAAVDLASFLM